MVLLADLGNRSLSLAIYQDRQVKATFKTSSDKFKSADEYQDTLRQFLLLQNVSPNQLEGAILASVVPSLTKRVEKAINSLLNTKCMVLSRNLKTGLAIRTDNPSEVGANLISAGVGAINNYHEDCLIICLSSCLTFTLVTKDNNFLGGSIFPGMRESVSHMCETSAQLMEIDLSRPSKTIGKSTKECINSGVVKGYMLLIDAMADEIEKEFGKPCKRILTGPDANIIKDYIGHQYTYNYHLLFDGLYDIYQKNMNSKKGNKSL